MAEFIQDISLTRFRKLIVGKKADELKELKTFAVTADGQHLFTVIIPQTDYIQVHADYLGQLSNSQGGKEIED